MVTKHRQLFGRDEIGIPGLETFGHTVFSKAALPLKMHVHEGCLEIVVVARGSESYHADGKEFRIERGKAFVSFLNQPHKSGGTCQNVSEIYWFQINPLCGGAFLGLSDENAKSLGQLLLRADSHVINADGECLYLVRKCLNALVGKADRLYLTASFVALLAKLFSSGNPADCPDYLIQRAKDYIEKNLSEQIRLEDVADELAVSLSTLKHKFKRHTGFAPGNYVNYRRIEKAKESLAAGLSVTDTAMDLGFNSSDYFSTVFKKFTATTPSAYAATAKKTPER